MTTAPIPQWDVPCRDLINRPTVVSVIAGDGRVAVVCPPGEVAVLTGQQAQQLHGALRSAVIAAAKADRGGDCDGTC
jgi:hypothetical protein